MVEGTDTSGVEESFQDLSEKVLASGEGRIRPRARLLRTIGAELISSEQVAIIELVRNCYDADATHVELSFTDPHLPEEASLEIRDNGHGMSRAILLGPWLEPATDHKAASGTGASAGVRSPKGRRRLGSKGVGRFAAQRLGRHLTLVTRTEDDEHELVAEFDWSRLDRADRYLDELRIPWRERPAEVLDSPGTSLNITQLTDEWRQERFETLRLGLSRLISPDMSAAGFRLVLAINDSVEEIRPALDTTESMYVLEGQVAADGSCVLRYSDMSGAEETWERRVVWPEEGEVCGPFSFRINGWDLDREPLSLFLEKRESKLGLRDFRRLVRSHSGISLYRDGFRILPYGEPDNDWLRLDRRRVNNPTMRLSNNQIQGWLKLTADGNPLLRDQTNREGLVSNGGYHHLQQVVLELLGYLESRRFSARRNLGVTWTRKSQALPTNEQEASRIDTLLEQLGSEGGQRAKGIRELRTLLDERQKDTVETIQHYASLASVGQMSGLVFQQLQHPLRQVKSELKLALSDVRGGDLDEEDLTDIAEQLATSIARLQEAELQMRRLDPLAVGRRAQRPVQMTAVEFVQPVLDAFQDVLDGAGVTLRVHGEKSVSREAPAIIIQQVLANLMNNALYWVQQNPGERWISLRFSSNGFHLDNNGPKLVEGDRDNIFEPHFTTLPDASGMGLTLARDLLQSIGGTVKARNMRVGVRFSVNVW